MIVQKYGGTSVKDPSRIAAVADRIKYTLKSENQIVVVVSAMGHTTDSLLSLAKEVHPNPPDREMDMLLSVGERISMSLLAMALEKIGVKSVSLTGSQSGVITDPHHRRARIIEVRPHRVLEELKTHQVVIVAGFQGVSRSKEITTLGRGGSDLTAVALSSALKATYCEIYSDVSGVYSANPNAVSGAKRYSEVPGFLLAEFAASGAQVFHHRSVELAIKENVKLFLKNSLLPIDATTSDIYRDTYTEIMTDPKLCQSESFLEQFKIFGVTHSNDLVPVCMKFQTENDADVAMGDLARFSESQSLILKMFGFSKQSLSAEFCIEKEFIQNWRDFIGKKADFFEDRSAVTVVGTRIGLDGAFPAELTGILKDEKIKSYRLHSHGNAVSIIVDANHTEKLVNRLHRVYF